MRLFVTGTDTDVGKTAITAALAAAARRVGPVCAAKPVASGVPDGHAGDDAESLGRAAGHAPRVFATFPAPVSPHRAAQLAGRPLDPAVLDWVRALSSANVLVEGVGGWRVPLGGGLWVRDLAHAANAPVLVVAANRLGVLNHTLLTVEAIRADGFSVVGVVLNGGLAHADDPSRGTNADDLRDLLDVPVAQVGQISTNDEAHAGAAVSHALGVIWSPA